MTLQELYDKIGGNYDQAIRVLRVEKLVDKHIKKYIGNKVVETLLAAGDKMDSKELFEAAHAVKGISANLGLTHIADIASRITEEFRPENSRNMTDDEVKELLKNLEEIYRRVEEGIKEYENGNQ